MARGFAASKTKKEFLQELGLIEGHPEHETLYERMLEEATAGRQRVSEHRENLVLPCRNNSLVRAPYTYNQITETARHQEILNIFNTASADTRALYERGRYFEGNTEENWVVKWCLYHSFRYTDVRNQHRSRSRRCTEAEETTNDRNPAGSPGLGGSTGQSEPGIDGRQSEKYFDPVRNRHT